MELYGGKLHFLTSLTGGFIFHRNDFWPNSIKIVVFLIFYILFLILLKKSKTSFLKIVYSSIISLFFLFIKLIVVWFNSLLDNSVNVSPTSSDEEFSFVIPPGISGPLWENRKILFNERYSMDDRAYQLVRFGFDVDEVFKLISLVQTGVVTSDIVDHAPSRRVKANIIVIFGKILNVNFDRESLSRTFSRPISSWHIFSGFILTFIASILISSIRDLSSLASSFFISLLYSLSVFSMLLPPNCDPYSTSFIDPYISYTRIFHIIFFTFLISILEYIKNNVPNFIFISEIQINLNVFSIINPLIDIFYYSFLLHPLLILFGLFGHPITTLHWGIESLNKYLFGISGSNSFFNSIGNFIWFFIVVLFVSSFLSVGNNPISVGASITIVTFITYFFNSLNCQEFMKNELFTAIGTSTLSGVTSLLNWIIEPNALYFFFYLIIFFNFTIHIIIPYITSHELYFIFYGRVTIFSYLYDYFHYTTQYITTPAFLSLILVKYPLSSFFSSLLIVHSLRISQTLPHIFCFALIIALKVLHDDLNINSISFCLLLSLLISRKFIKIIRLSRFWYKFRSINSNIFKDPFTDTYKFIKGVIYTELVSLFPHYLGGFSGPSFLWSLFTGAPMSILFG